MANPATFGQPTIPVTINLPASQLPQTAAPAPQPQPPQPAPVPAPAPQKQPTTNKLPPARYYVFPWKH